MATILTENNKPVIRNNKLQLFDVDKCCKRYKCEPTLDYTCPETEEPLGDVVFGSLAACVAFCRELPPPPPCDAGYYRDASGECVKIEIPECLPKELYYWDGEECVDKITPDCPDTSCDYLLGTPPGCHFNLTINECVPNCTKPVNPWGPGYRWNPRICDWEPDCPDEQCLDIYGNIDYSKKWDSDVCDCVDRCDIQDCKEGNVWDPVNCICYPCSKYTLASFTTNADNPEWDLTPYQGPGAAAPNSCWRLAEVGVRYSTGTVDETGELVGLPDKFISHYSYDGFMTLKIGCRNPGGGCEF